MANHKKPPEEVHQHRLEYMRKYYHAHKDYYRQYARAHKEQHMQPEMRCYIRKLIAAGYTVIPPEGSDNAETER